MTSDQPHASTLVVLTGDGCGTGEAALRQKLLATWLKLVLENGALPGAMAFYTEGVRLVVEGSPVLEALRALEAKGVHLIVCTTCLNHYGLMEKVAVGTVGGMGDIIAAQWKAKKVLTL